MTPEQIATRVRKYDADLEALGYEAHKCDDEADDLTPGQRIEHVRWMCQQIPGYIAEGHLEKVHRWLGFIQGVLHSVETGRMPPRTIASLKDDNR